MGLRESLNKNPAVAAGLAVVIVVVAVVLMVWSFSGGSGRLGTNPGEPKQFYTIDDGTTWFADAWGKPTPFDKDGKPAVTAHVYRDLDSKKDFVAYLSRMTPEGRKTAEEQARRTAAGEFGAMEGVVIAVEYKRPGETAWIRSTDPRAIHMISEIKSPSGSNNVEPVYPE